MERLPTENVPLTQFLSSPNIRKAWIKQKGDWHGIVGEGIKGEKEVDSTEIMHFQFTMVWLLQAAGKRQKKILRRAYQANLSLRQAGN